MLVGRAFCSLLVLVAAGSLAQAQPAARWQTTVEGARRIAAQNNQLVLIHFWAPYCTACRRMEQEVFTDRAVSAAIQTYYVPVKVNTEYFPATANQFGITALPTDVIITPDGQVLNRIEGMVSASEYSARLSQSATSHRPQSQSPVYAQMAPPAAQSQPSPPATAPGYQPAAAAPPVASPMAGANPYAGMVPPSAQPAVPPNAYPGMIPPPAQAPASQAPPAGSAGLVSNAPPVAANAPATSGNPPLGLDGFCPVRLVEVQKWVAGDPRWGVIHQGRTYLFAGSDEQARFYAKPDAFAPAMNGHDVVLALETGQMVPGNRRHGVYYGNRVYLFTSEESLQKFERQPERYATPAQHAYHPASHAPAR